ncbi:4941_t:CDS:1, partial [Funneliformis geosporum]
SVEKVNNNETDKLIKRIRYSSDTPLPSNILSNQKETDNKH